MTNMNEKFIEAEVKIKLVISSLSHLLDKDNTVDISYYTPEILDAEILRLIQARALMSVGEFGISLFADSLFGDNLDEEETPA